MNLIPPPPSPFSRRQAPGRFRNQSHPLLALAIGLLLGPRADADLLDPLDFTSLGAHPFTAAGAYVIDTAATTPTMRLPDLSTINGSLFGGIAVFTFDNITIGTGMTIRAMRDTGSRPFALLSLSFFDLPGGLIQADGLNGVSNGFSLAGGAGGNAGAGGGGGGGGAAFQDPALGGLGAVNRGNGGGGLGNAGDGGDGGSIEPGGGGSGAMLDPDTFNVPGGGGAFGGGGGYGPFAVNGGAGGGGGGGAFELGAVGAMNLAGMLRANGGDGGNAAQHRAGGSGAGGGIFIHAATVSLTGTIEAMGGDGGITTDSTPRVGGPGGGGRVLILTNSGALSGGGLNVDVRPGDTDIGTRGQSGSVDLGQIPEPGTGALLAAGLLAAASARHRGRRSQAR